MRGAKGTRTPGLLDANQIFCVSLRGWKSPDGQFTCGDRRRLSVGVARSLAPLALCLALLRHPSGRGGGTRDARVLTPTASPQAAASFRGHPDAAIYLSQPGTGEILGAQQLGEFGDDPHRYASAKARKNYAATSPVTRQSGKKKIVMARFTRNDRLTDAVHRQAQSALRASPGARAFYDEHATAAWTTTPRCGPCPTGWSASCTAASRPAPSTTRPPPGHTEPPLPQPLDNQSPGVSLRTLRSETKGQAGACPDQARAIPSKVQPCN